MVTFTIEEIVERFDTFRVGVMLVEGLTLERSRSLELEEVVRKSEESIGSSIGQTELGEIPELKCWRRAYKAFGEKSTSYRSSVERLVKLVQRGQRMPRICNLVDLYNAVSLTYLMPVGADDLDKLVQPMGFRFARGDETFVRLGDESGRMESPIPGEVVYVDLEKCLCRRWNWHQDARSAINVDMTNRAVLTVQGLEPTSARRVEEACEMLSSLLTSECKARNTWAVVDRSSVRTHLQV